MNLDFIVEGLENFANWGGVFADIFSGFGDLFGEDGLPALSSALEGTEDAGTGDGGETGGGETGDGETGDGDTTEGLSSGLSSDDTGDE